MMRRFLKKEPHDPPLDIAQSIELLEEHTVMPSNASGEFPEAKIWSKYFWGNSALTIELIIRRL
jgi:hypothetical protein